jgi:mono/diheme cytochrome c family protein
LGWKLFWTLLSGVAVWVASGLIGFPKIFKVFFVGYVVLGLLFFLLLDARPLRLPYKPIAAIVTFFIIASAVLTLAGVLLPQYDPAVEMEKIRRIQQIAREQEQEKQQKAITEAVEAAKKELLAQLEKEGLTKVAKKVPPVEAIPPVAEAKLIAFGKLVYNDYECYNCHKIGGKGGVKRRGPELDNIGNLVSAEMLKKKLLDPYAFSTEGFEKEFKKAVMPDNYPELMTEKEMDALVAYMLTLRNTAVNTPKPIFDVKRPE